MRAFSKTVARARSLRRTMTAPETHLWSLLRRKSVSLRFRRQHPMGAYILDFYCPSAKLCVEIDGVIHDEQHLYDTHRTKWLERQGVRVLRFGADEVLESINQTRILAEIVRAATHLGLCHPCLLRMCERVLDLSNPLDKSKEGL